MNSRTFQVAFVLALVYINGANVPDINAQSPEPLCVELGTDASEGLDDLLAGRLGGSRVAFEKRFGQPASEDLFSVQYELEGCGDLSVSYEDDVLTDILFFTPGYLDADHAEWTFGQAMQIAARLLPLDVEQRVPFRNVSFVEHQPCFSNALAAQVPVTVYEYVDDNPTPGQCSVSYEFDDAGDVLMFTVQLEIEDMS